MAHTTVRLFRRHRHLEDLVDFNLSGSCCRWDQSVPPIIELNTNRSRRNANVLAASG
jgi:hypothetical protein